MVFVLSEVAYSQVDFECVKAVGRGARLVVPRIYFS